MTTITEADVEQAATGGVQRSWRFPASSVWPKAASRLCIIY